MFCYVDWADVCSLLLNVSLTLIYRPNLYVQTCMQGDIERKVYGSLSQTAALIYSESGIPGFYRGATFRYGRMVCAVFIMDFMKDFMGQLMYPAAFK